MNDERFALSVRPEVIFDLIEDRHLFAFPLQRNRQQAGGFVQDDQVLVLVEDIQRSRLERHRPPPRAARPVFPDSDFVACVEAPANIARVCFAAVDKDFPALAGGGRLRSGPEPICRGEKLVECLARFRGGDGPCVFWHE